MLVTRGDLFDYIGKVDALCITTNGFVKSNGACVMGRGCAKLMCTIYPGIDKILGNLIRQYGNYPFALVSINNTWICSFPVKPVSEEFVGNNAVKHMLGKFQYGSMVPGWACLARMDIIVNSAQYLVGLANSYNWQRIILPRPGCGAGELTWNQVGPILAQYLDDRFLVITY